MLNKKQRSFLISQQSKHAKIWLSTQESSSPPTQITYYTDCVYEPIKYDIQFHIKNQTPQSQHSLEQQLQIQMDFGFLIQETQKHKRILSNIGVLVIKTKNASKKYGILVTEQKGKLFVSFIK